ncbi:MAG TPA: DUF1844 domain-containing protein [Pyrinomonadaceae bacterium]|jgi:hypothetical protein
MIGKEENNEEQPVLKVTDRRKFNLDGSVREGVVIEPEKPKEEEKTAKEEPVAVPAETPSAEPASAETADESATAFDEEEIPGEDDPASFVSFLTTVATNAAASLGAMPHPVSGKRTVDLETGKYWIDVLSMLREKTEGNLHPQEARLFEGLLGDLRMQYVQLVRVTEEKLKQQAAQKFSAGDILGKK